jgi:hypothetical protein
MTTDLTAADTPAEPKTSKADQFLHEAEITGAAASHVQTQGTTIVLGLSVHGAEILADALGEWALNTEGANTEEADDLIGKIQSELQGQIDQAHRGVR